VTAAVSDSEIIRMQLERARQAFAEAYRPDVDEALAALARLKARDDARGQK
jgi:hypothetical protein